MDIKDALFVVDLEIKKIENAIDDYEQNKLWKKLREQQDRLYLQLEKQEKMEQEKLEQEKVEEIQK